MTTQQVVFVGYVVVTGIISFILWGVDKRKANTDKWRISEKVLLRSIGLGGWVGGIVGMSYFRHKTIKISFLRKFWCIVIAWLIITLVVLFSAKQ